MDIVESSSSSCVDVPPGFRFHPTEEELVGYYLNRKINSLKIDLDVIVHIDLYRIEPWEIQGSCNLGYDEQKEWYFFSHKDRKYPTGTRTNRATAAGFWKATGRDKTVFSKDNKMVIGMRKTLVYYKGRAPNGRKSDWIMHEYRLHTSDQHQPPQEEGWVVCRAFKKPSSISQQKQLGCWNNNNNTILINHHHHHQQQSSPLLSSNIIYEQDQMVDLIPNLHDHSLSISGFTGFPSTNDGFDQDLIHGDHQREFLVIDGDHDTQLIDESGQVMAADSRYSSFLQFQNTPFIDHTHN